MRLYSLLLLLVLFTVGFTGCSPEAQRTRGGGPGADVGNRGATVQLHGDVPPAQRMFYRTPHKEAGPTGSERTL